jgi:hypothetical protein
MAVMRSKPFVLCRYLMSGVMDGTNTSAISELATSYLLGRPINVTARARSTSTTPALYKAGIDGLDFQLSVVSGNSSVPLIAGTRFGSRGIQLSAAPGDSTYVQV